MADQKDRLPTRTRAVLCNLQTARLNEQLVEVVRFIADQQRYKVRPIGQEAKQLAPSPTMSIKRENLRRVNSSAFWHRVNYLGNDLKIPCDCETDKDGFGNTGIRVVYSLWAGKDALKPTLKAFFDDEDDWNDEQSIQNAVENSAFGIATSPIHDAQARTNLRENEVLIIRKKQEGLLNALLDFELVEEIHKTADVGYYGALPLFKIKFPLS